MPISAVWILNYVQQCSVKWFWTISSLGAPVYIDINRRDYFDFVREKGKTLVSFLQSWTLTLFLSNSKLSPTDRPTPKEHSWWPLTTDSRIASFDAGFHIIRRLWHLACVLVFEIEGNTFGNIFDLNDLFETQRWNWFYVQSLKSSISDRLSVRLALFWGAGEGGVMSSITFNFRT